MKLFLIFLICSILIIPQSYTCKISRHASIDAKNISFDIYLKNTNATTLLLNGMQIGLYFNKACIGKGTVSIVRDTTDIPAMFVNYPTLVTDDTTVVIRQTYSVYGDNKSLVQNDSMLVGRYILTNTVNFAYCPFSIQSDSLLKWDFVIGDILYPTGVIATIGGDLTDVTSSGTFTSTFAIKRK